MTEKAARVEASAVPTKKLLIACILAYLLPGAGHLVLGKKWRAAIFSCSIFAMFILGLLMKGRLFFPTSGDITSFFLSFADAGVGSAYFICLIFDIGFDSLRAAAATFEYGNAFLWTAGLLNMLVIMDAYDIAIGRKN
ncbi:MAG: DUF6677 family protein [Acidobacteriota bacterium]|nr:hypothetical protein [Blastocatellia bacterium]MDW8411290.1 DUF6677 family protein [Acidobacteriota bacterium]